MNNPDILETPRYHQDAPSYLREVEHDIVVRRSDKDTYKAFHTTMEDWINKPLSTPAVLAKLKDVLHEYPHLIEGFKAFFHISYRLDNGWDGLFVRPLVNSNLREYVATRFIVDDGPEIHKDDTWTTVHPACHECYVAFWLNCCDVNTDEDKVVRKLGVLFRRQLPEIMDVVERLASIRFGQGKQEEERSGDSTDDDSISPWDRLWTRVSGDHPLVVARLSQDISMITRIMRSISANTFNPPRRRSQHPG